MNTKYPEFSSIIQHDWGAICAFKQVLRVREHVPASWLRLRSTAKPNGSKDLLNTFKSTFGGTLGRLLSARCAQRETKLVGLIYA
jgi:hypothetical protein